MKPYPLTELCPCESGEIYKSCCKKKDLFYKDENGNIIQQIPLVEEAQELITKYQQEFAEIFGREPESNEPIFFLTLLMSEDDYFENLEKVFAQVNIPKEKFYAYKKTGYVVTTQNIKHLPDRVIKQWNAAIKEYRDIKRGKKKVEIPQFALDIDFTLEKLGKLQYLYALIIRKLNESLKEGTSVNGILKNDYLLFCITKNLKTLKSSLTLIKENLGEDALNLIRSIFENYLHISNALNNSEEFINEIEIKAGVLLGTYAIPKHGSSKVTNVKTGEIYNLKFNNKFKLASLHPDYGEIDEKIYEFLYDFLSSYTHPDFRSLANYIDIDGFTHLRRTSITEAIIYSCFLNVILMREIIKWDVLDETSKKDINRFIHNIKPSLLRIFAQMENDIPTFPKEFQEHILLI